MKYSVEQINKMADARMQRLMNDEYKVEVLPNSAELYYHNTESRDSCAIQETNSSSRLFRVVFDD